MLRAYVDRINLNPDDAPLQVGTGKELDEAVAPHVLLERVGQYPTGGPAGSFPVTLAQAFTVLGLEVPPGSVRSPPLRTLDARSSNDVVQVKPVLSCGWVKRPEVRLGPTR